MSEYQYYEFQAVDRPLTPGARVMAPGGRAGRDQAGEGVRPGGAASSKDLHDLSVRQEQVKTFTARLGPLRERCAKRPALLDRLDKAELRA